MRTGKYAPMQMRCHSFIAQGCQLPIAQDGSFRPEGQSHPSAFQPRAEPESANPGSPHLINWPWPAALLAQVTEQSDDNSGTSKERLLLVSPTAPGLDALESSGHTLSALWVLAVDTDGPGALLGYRVEEITNLGSTTADGRQLTFLRGPGDRLIAIEGDDLCVHDSASINWKESSRYKCRPASSKA